MLRLRVEIDGLRQFDDAFGKIIRTLGDLTPIWPKVGEWFYETEQRLFFTEGASGGSKWPALSAAYDQEKGRTHPFMPLMRRTDTLYRSLTRKGAPEGVYQETKDSLTLGSTRRGAKAHMRPSGRRPARPPIQISRQDADKMMKIVRRKVSGILRREQSFVQVEESF